MVVPKMHLHEVPVLIKPQPDFYKHVGDTKSSLHVLKVEVQVQSKQYSFPEIE